MDTFVIILVFVVLAIVADQLYNLHLGKFFKWFFRYLFNISPKHNPKFESDNFVVAVNSNPPPNRKIIFMDGKHCRAQILLNNEWANVRYNGGSMWTMRTQDGKEFESKDDGITWTRLES